MQVGINYAWKNYGWDFGLPPKKNDGSSWGERAAWQSTIDRDLARFVEVGFFCVRWFLLGDGTNYGVGVERPRLDPRGNNPWRFASPPRISEEFLHDFERLIARFEAAGIQLLPSLLDFHFCLPGVRVPGTDEIIKGGRRDALLDIPGPADPAAPPWPHQRTQFLDGVVDPLLEVAARHPRAIYAFEVMNEPEWCTQDPARPPAIHDPSATVPLPEMRAFVREAAARINHAGFRSTVGFSHYDTLSRWDCAGLGLTLDQFHYYGDPSVLPVNPHGPRAPTMIGELATAPHRPWPELGASQDLLSRLRLAADKGYPTAFLWSANRDEQSSTDPSALIAVDASDANLALVRRYLDARYA